MAQRDGEGVGGVGGGWGSGEGEEGLYHHADLLFGAVPEGGDEFFDLVRFVDGDGEAGLGRGEDGDGARLTDSDGGAGIAEEEVFDGNFLRPVFADDVDDRFVDADEALGVRRFGGRGDGAEVKAAMGGAVGDDDAVAGTREAGVDAEDGDETRAGPTRRTEVTQPRTPGGLTRGSRRWSRPSARRPALR